LDDHHPSPCSASHKGSRRFREMTTLFWKATLPKPCFSLFHSSVQPPAFLTTARRCKIDEHTRITMPWGNRALGGSPFSPVARARDVLEGSAVVEETSGCRPLWRALGRARSEFDVGGVDHAGPRS